LRQTERWQHFGSLDVVFCIVLITGHILVAYISRKFWSNLFGVCHALPVCAVLIQKTKCVYQ